MDHSNDWLSVYWGDFLGPTDYCPECGAYDGLDWCCTACGLVLDREKKEGGDMAGKERQPRA